MPIIGMFIGSYITKFIHIGEDLIVLIIFSLIGINMIIESRKDQEEIKHMKLGEMLLFGFAVSVDSFSVGIGINNISNNFLICSYNILPVSISIKTARGAEISIANTVVLNNKKRIANAILFHFILYLQTILPLSRQESWKSRISLCQLHF